MKKVVVISCLGIYLLANNEYIPLSQISDNKKEEYNFNKETKVKVKENNEIMKEYKSENILNDEIKPSKNSFSYNFTKDFSVTPKISYMYVDTSFEGENIKKTHEVIPEISFIYKNHTLKADYLNVNSKIYDVVELDTSWYRLSYLYKYYNANIGLGYNDIRADLTLIGKKSIKDDERFPTLELHFKNTKDQLVFEYGGFYGKNDNNIEDAYEYYINLGYKIFNNDNLILNAGYKNRTIEFDGDFELEYKGPILGISSTF